jgi:hypothetical protein
MTPRTPEPAALTALLDSIWADLEAAEGKLRDLQAQLRVGEEPSYPVYRLGAHATELHARVRRALDLYDVATAAASAHASGAPLFDARCVCHGCRALATCAEVGDEFYCRACVAAGKAA